MKIDGGCRCSAVRYEAKADPAKVAICHCTDCQVMTGSAFVVFVPVAEEDFRLVSGEPRVYLKQAESGNMRELVFCPDCSSLIYSTSAGKGPRRFALRAGTARQRDALPPKAQIWWRSAQPWVKDLIGEDAMPTMERQ